MSWYDFISLFADVVGIIGAASRENEWFSESALPEIIDGVEASLNAFDEQELHNLYFYYAGPAFVAIRIGERFKNHFRVRVMHFEAGRGYRNTGDDVPNA